MNQPRILIVEDEPTSARYLKSLLARLSCQVIGEVTNGGEALDLTEVLQPDLILMDIKLPGPIDGIDAARTIMGRFQIPVIFLTAYSDDQTVDRAKAVGSYGFLIKPVQKEELKASIAVALAKATMDRRLRAAQEFFNLLAKNVTDIIYTLDLDLKLTFITPSIQKLAGYLPEEIISRPLSQTMTPSAFKLMKASYAHIEPRLSEGFVPGPVRLNLDLVHLDGSVIHTEHNLSIFTDDLGHPAGILGVGRDVTKRKQQEVELHMYRSRLEELVGQKTKDLLAINERLALEVAERKYLSLNLVKMLEAERQALARELHENLGLALTSIKLGLELLPPSVNSDQDAAIKAVLRHVENAIREVQNISRGLRPAALTGLGLEPAIEAIVNQVRLTTGLDIVLFVGTMPPSLDGDIALALYRITQEALNNIVKHAQASQVHVTMTRQGPAITLAIEDNGRGFNLQDLPMAMAQTLGLILMKERAAQVGGELHVESQPDQGTRVSVFIPI